MKGNKIRIKSYTFPINIRFSITITKSNVYGGNKTVVVKKKKTKEKGKKNNRDCHKNHLTGNIVSNGQHTSENSSLHLSRLTSVIPRRYLMMFNVGRLYKV